MQQTIHETSPKRSAHAAQRETIGWSNIDQPGFYVSRTTGQGYRITKDLLIPGASPALSVLGAEHDRFVLVSEEPFVPVTAARILCADNDITPTF